MNICVRNLDSNETQWFSILSETHVLKEEIETFIKGRDFSVIDQSESTFKFKEISCLNNLISTAETIKEIISKNIPVELIQKIADYYGFLLPEALSFHETNFIEDNNNIEDFTCNYMLLKHDKEIAGLPPIIRENIDWLRIYETISVNDVIAFKVKSTNYFYRR